MIPNVSGLMNPYVPESINQHIYLANLFKSYYQNLDIFYYCLFLLSPIFFILTPKTLMYSIIINFSFYLIYLNPKHYKSGYILSHLFMG
jgi:hypothetical protein